MIVFIYYSKRCKKNIFCCSKICFLRLRKALCNCLCSSSSRFSASIIPNIREFGTKYYFTDHRTVNTIVSFSKSVLVLKIHGYYQDALTTFHSYPSSTYKTRTVLMYKQATLNSFQTLQTVYSQSNCLIDQSLYCRQIFQPIFLAK